jgi:hypothetical protein
MSIGSTPEHLERLEKRDVIVEHIMQFVMNDPTVADWIFSQVTPLKILPNFATDEEVEAYEQSPEYRLYWSQITMYTMQLLSLVASKMHA